MNKPIIGIVSKPNVFCKDKLFTHQIIYDGIRNAILKNGGLIIGILPTKVSADKTDNVFLMKEEMDDLYYLIDKCDGIILQGGLTSENYEIEIAKYAIKNDIPILGICSGFNNIVRAMGGNVFSLDDNSHNQEDGSIVHKNIIKKDSLLYNILNTHEIEVNSIHTTFSKKEDIKNLEISAYSNDGYVEAVELRNKKFVLGLKWHPDLMISWDKNMNKIFSSLVNSCKK